MSELYFRVVRETSPPSSDRLSDRPRRTGSAEQRQKEPDKGREDSHLAIELRDGIERLPPVPVEPRYGVDLAEAALLPGGNGGSWDGKVPGERAGAEDVLAEAVVVGAASLRRGRDNGCHEGSIFEDRPPTNTSVIFSVPQLWTRKS